MGKLAIIFGGNSVEHEISIITAFSVMNELKKHQEDFFPIYLSREGIFYCGKGLMAKENYQNKKGFLKGFFKPEGKYYVYKYRRKKIIIDHVLLCVHGQNVEDGALGAFFDILNIPVSYPGIFNSALLQDKEMTKIFLKSSKIPTAKYQIIAKEEYENITDLGKITFPKIVKPVHLGSSIGVSKVNNIEELETALEVAFTFDSRVLIEEVIPNLHEYNIAVLGEGADVLLSEIEEVNNTDRVLSFENKYQEFANITPTRILPAEIADNPRKEIEKYTRLVYQKLNLCGVMRFDYLYDAQNKKIYLNEINTIPGSLAYYLFEAIGVPFIELLSQLVALGEKRYRQRKSFQNYYQNSDLRLLKSKK